MKQIGVQDAKGGYIVTYHDNDFNSVQEIFTNFGQVVKALRAHFGEERKVAEAAETPVAE